MDEKLFSARMAADKEKVEKDRKTAFALGVVGTAAILVIFVMQVITGSIVPFAQG